MRSAFLVLCWGRGDGYHSDADTCGYFYGSKNCIGELSSKTDEQIGKIQETDPAKIDSIMSCLKKLDDEYEYESDAHKAYEQKEEDCRVDYYYAEGTEQEGESKSAEAKQADCTKNSFCAWDGNCGVSAAAKEDFFGPDCFYKLPRTDDNAEAYDAWQVKYREINAAIVEACALDEEACKAADEDDCQWWTPEDEDDGAPAAFCSVMHQSDRAAIEAGGCNAANVKALAWMTMSPIGKKMSEIEETVDEGCTDSHEKCKKWEAKAKACSDSGIADPHSTSSAVAFVLLGYLV